MFGCPQSTLLLWLLHSVVNFVMDCLYMKNYYCSVVEPVCCVLRLLYIVEDKLDTKDHFDTPICYELIVKYKEQKP